MKTLIAIPVMGSFEIGRISLYQFDQTTSPDCRFLIIDNTQGQSPYESLFKRGFLSEDRWCYHKVDGPNLGLIKSCQLAYEYAMLGQYDVLILTHNDVWLYPPMDLEEEWGSNYWDKVLASEFESSKFSGEFGVVGLFGSKGCGKEGHRLNTFGSLIEVAGHGRKMTNWIEPAVCLDGFFLACSMKMLDKAMYHKVGGAYTDSVTNGTQFGGFDQRYEWHHVYDYDISLTSIELGFKNAVINIPCHHLSGMTANNDAFATSGQDVHQANYDRWKAKWSHKLGVSVDDNWNYTWGQG